MPDELPPTWSVEVPPHFGASDHESWSNGYPTGADPNNAYAMSHGDYDPRARYSHNTGQYELLHPVSVNAGHRGNQSHSGSYVPAVPSLPRPEYHAPVAPVPNDAPPSQGPLMYLVAGPSEGYTDTVHPGMSAAKNLKHLASQYLFSPDSHVDKVRVRRSRSGRFKVLIMLEIEDSM